MRALVISGGGSKGAFAGGVAQYLMEDKARIYDMFVGTSTGSLMVTHLALGKIKELRDLYTNVTQSSIFSNCPFIVKKTNNHKTVRINHFNTLKSFINGKKTFGESKNLKKLIDLNITDEYIQRVKDSDKDVIVTVSNLTLNQVEYKSIKDHSYEDFRDWIWISGNYVPFMSLVEKNHYEYADGGFANLVPVEEAINCGATEVDAIILRTEAKQLNRLPSKNPFLLMMNVFGYMKEYLEHHNILVGKLKAKHKNVKLNLYFTPIILTTNSLIFDKKEMEKWWEEGYQHAKNKDVEVLDRY